MPLFARAEAWGLSLDWNSRPARSGEPALFEFLGGPSPMVGHVFEGKLKFCKKRKEFEALEG